MERSKVNGLDDTRIVEFVFMICLGTERLDDDTRLSMTAEGAEICSWVTEVKILIIWRRWWSRSLQFVS